MARGSGGSVVFAVLYAITLLYYLRRTIDNTTYVFIMLSFFCAIRVTTLALRGVIEGSGYTREESTAAAALYSAGFALLDSAYTLVLDREIANGYIAKNPISRATSNRWLVRFFLAVAVVVWVAEAAYPDKANRIAFALTKVTLSIFLAVTVVLGIKAVVQAYEERAALKRGRLGGETSGTTYVTYIPCLIVILLLACEVYFIVRTSTLTSQKMVIWYLFAVTPELLAVLCFAVPGPVPKKRGPVPYDHEHEDPEVMKSV